MDFPAPGWAVALAAAVVNRFSFPSELCGGFGTYFRYGTPRRADRLGIFPFAVLVHDDENSDECYELTPPFVVDLKGVLAEFDDVAKVEHVIGRNDGYGDYVRIKGTYHGHSVDVRLHTDCPEDIPPSKYCTPEGVLVDFEPNDPLPCTVASPLWDKSSRDGEPPANGQGDAFGGIC